MKIQASITLSIILMGLLAAYTIPGFTQWEDGEIYYLWNKCFDFLLLRLSALLLKDKVLKFAFHATACFFILRCIWEVVAWRYGYWAASRQYIILCLFLATVAIIIITTLKGWKQRSL